MTLCSSKTVCAAKTPLCSQSLTGLYQIFLLKWEMRFTYCQKVQTRFQYQLPFPESHSACSSSKAGFTILTCRIKEDFNNLSKFFSLLPCVGKLTTDEMHLSRKNLLLNFAIQSLFKSHCKIVEQHVGRYFLKMGNNLCPSSHGAFYPTHVSNFSLCDKA